MLKNALLWVLAAALAFGLSAVAGTSYTAPPPDPGSQPAAVPVYLFAWSGICALGLVAACLIAGVPI